VLGSSLLSAQYYAQPTKTALQEGWDPPKFDPEGKAAEEIRALWTWIEKKVRKGTYARQSPKGRRLKSYGTARVKTTNIRGVLRADDSKTKRPRVKQQTAYLPLPSTANSANWPLSEERKMHDYLLQGLDMVFYQRTQVDRRASRGKQG